MRPHPTTTQPKLVYGVNPAGGATVVLLYIMRAAPNAATSAEDWQIKYCTYDTSDNLLDYKYPRDPNGNASAEFKFIADNYLTYTYGAA